MNKKILRIMSVILSVVMLFGCAVTASAASSKITVRVEGLNEYIDSDDQYITSEKTLREVLKAAEVDVVFAEGSDVILSVEGEEATEHSKWQVAVNGAIVNFDIDEYVIDSDSLVVLFNAAEDAVMPQIDDSELSSAGILVFNGIDKNGDTAPIGNLKVVWDDVKTYTTDKDGKIYISENYLAEGEHKIAISKVNGNKVSVIVRLDPDATVEVEAIEGTDKEETSTFDEIYSFFYDIFKGIVDVWVFFLSAIGGLLGITG